MALVTRAAPTLTRPQLMHLLFLLGADAPGLVGPGYYRFVPFLHGPFSFLCYRELVALDFEGYFLGDDRPRLDKANRSILRREWGLLGRELRQAILQLLRRHGDQPLLALQAEVRRRDPWLLAAVDRVPQATAPGLYTVGYQDRSIDEVLGALLRRSVRRLIDVRARPRSRRYGFDGRELARLCEHLQIDYQHLPELGRVPGPWPARAPRERAEGCARLRHGRPVPPEEAVTTLAAAIQRGGATALLCAEADPAACQRADIAQALSEAAAVPVSHL